MENFGKFITWLIALMISPIINGFVSFKLWNWFLITMFGIEPINYFQAVGLMVIAQFMLYKYKDSEKIKDDPDIWQTMVKRIFSLIFHSCLVLLFGWVVTQFI